MFALILVFLCVIMGAFGQISMKKGMSQLDTVEGISDLLNPGMLAQMLTNVFVIVGLLLYGISAILWLGALSTLDVSYMYPLLSLGYVLTAALAFVFFKEDVTLLRWVGVILIVAGCFVVGRTG